MVIEAAYALVAGAAVFGSRTPAEGCGEGTLLSCCPPAHPARAGTATHRHLRPSEDRNNEERTRPLVET